jgi:hypothetical protein
MHASNTASTKAEAQSTGRDMAQRGGAEHIIKKMDGTIGEKNSYGNDPNPPRASRAKALGSLLSGRSL